jgi:hypothetical protein
MYKNFLQGLELRAKGSSKPTLKSTVLNLDAL